MRRNRIILNRILLIIVFIIILIYMIFSFLILVRKNIVFCDNEVKDILISRCPEINCEGIIFLMKDKYYHQIEDIKIDIIYKGNKGIKRTTIDYEQIIGTNLISKISEKDFSLKNFLLSLSIFLIFVSCFIIKKYKIYIDNEIKLAK